MIQVIYRDGTVSSVGNDVLDVLIATARIKYFRRSGDWVKVDGRITPLRSYKKCLDYKGLERRAPWPDSLRRRQNQPV